MSSSSQPKTILLLLIALSVPFYSLCFTAAIIEISVLFCISAAAVHSFPHLNKKDYPSFKAYPDYQVDRSTDLDTFLKHQKHVSLYYLLQNIAYPNNHFINAPAGTVIASPSTIQPDYYYQWTRDSAITFLSVIAEIEDNGFNMTLAEVVEHYISKSYLLQRTSNPSGSFNNKNHDGLGEPKFNTDGSEYTGNWGRPQNDGPALRAYVICRYLSDVELLNKGKLVSLINLCVISPKEVYVKIVKPDLEFVVSYWNSTGFDLWEENQGSHFFTNLVQQKAVRYGADTAYTYGDIEFSNTILSTAESIATFMGNNESGYIDSNKNHIVETPELLKQGSRKGLDSATFIGSLLTHDINENSETPFGVDNKYVLQSFYLLLEDNKKRYTFNSKYASGAAVGRYPEDTYDGFGASLGNPWFLSTAYAAQVPYNLAYKAQSESKDIVIDEINYELFDKYIIELSSIDSSYRLNRNVSLKYGTDSFKKTISSLIRFGDSFLQVILDHIVENGSMTEQIERVSGNPTGAYSLTWSSGSLLEAIRLRDKVKSLNGQYLGSHSPKTSLFL